VTHPAIEVALKYLHDRGSKIPTDILVSLNVKEMKQAGEYQSIRQEMWAAVYDAIYDFLNGNAQVGTYSRLMSTAVSKAYIEAADTGYEDGGGTLPLDEDTAAWARAELEAQFGFIDSLFETLKQLRKEDDVDVIHEAFRHADGYANSLDALYNGAKLAGAGNKMLTFTGDDGKESCTDCSKYKGQRHRATWWVAHNAIPPSRSFECRGYNCAHYLEDDDGEEFTI
jgi:hypothetical protein